MSGTVNKSISHENDEMLDENKNNTSYMDLPIMADVVQSIGDLVRTFSWELCRLIEINRDFATHFSIFPDLCSASTKNLDGDWSILTSLNKVRYRIERSGSNELNPLDVRRDARRQYTRPVGLKSEQTDMYT